MTNVRILALLICLVVAIASWALTCAAWRADRVMAGVAPLDARSFGGFTLVTAATGGAYENRDRLGPATVVARGERVALVDAGRGTTPALRDSRIPVSQPDTVYLTSLLPENTLGLDDLLVTGWLVGRSNRLRLVGPPGTAAMAADIERSLAAGIAARAEALGIDPVAAGFDAVEVGDGWSEEIAGIRARAGEMPGGPLPAVAWRFDCEGRSAVVAGMGWAPEALVDFARGAHVLVHEAAFVPTPELAGEIGLAVDADRLEREAALHTALDAVGGLAQRAGVETLVLVRLRPPPVYAFQITGLVGDRFSGRIVVAEDGDELAP